MANQITVFLSYSRRDLIQADAIATRMRARGYKVLRDMDDILPTEAWRDRLQVLIEEADAVVFLLSPESARSEVCAWEVQYADRLNKKIAPIVVSDVNGADIPPILSRLNYIFATEEDRLENAVNSLSDALSGAAEWLRQHTFLLSAAKRWQSSSPAEFLTGAALEEAEKWLLGRPREVPPPAPMVIDFVAASREHQTLAEVYTRERLRALASLVEPLLRDRMATLDREIARSDQSVRQVELIRRWSMAGQLEAEKAAIRNFQRSGGRWHPEPAVHHTTADATMDYAEVYQFPCCGKYTVLQDPGQPHQFRADGCSGPPLGLGLRSLP